MDVPTTPVTMLNIVMDRRVFERVISAALDAAAEYVQHLGWSLIDDCMVRHDPARRTDSLYVANERWFEVKREPTESFEWQRIVSQWLVEPRAKPMGAYR